MKTTIFFLIMGLFGLSAHAAIFGPEYTSDPDVREFFNNPSVDKFSRLNAEFTQPLVMADLMVNDASSPQIAAVKAVLVGAYLTKLSSEESPYKDIYRYAFVMAIEQGKISAAKQFFDEGIRTEKDKSQAKAEFVCNTLKSFSPYMFTQFGQLSTQELKSKSREISALAQVLGSDASVGDANCDLTLDGKKTNRSILEYMKIVSPAITIKAKDSVNEANKGAISQPKENSFCSREQVKSEFQRIKNQLDFWAENQKMRAPLTDISRYDDSNCVIEGFFDYLGKGQYRFRMNVNSYGIAKRTLDFKNLDEGVDLFMKTQSTNSPETAGSSRNHTANAPRPAAVILPSADELPRPAAIIIPAGGVR